MNVSVTSCCRFSNRWQQLIHRPRALMVALPLLPVPAWVQTGAAMATFAASLIATEMEPAPATVGRSRNSSPAAAARPRPASA